MLGAMLEQVGSAVLEGDTLVLHLGEAATALRKRLEDEDTRSVLRECATRAAGSPVGVWVAPSQTVTQAPLAKTKPAPGKPDRDSPATKETEPKKREDRGQHGSLLERAKKDPAIQKLLHDFGAQVVDIKPLGTPGDVVTGDVDGGPVEESS